jgi:hypothetical protein
MNEVVLVANLVATLVMVGVIWFVQIVHYPLLAIVPIDSASSTALIHQRRTAFVVGLPMAVEGFSTLALLGAAPTEVWWWMPWMGGVLLAVALGSTVLLSVPRHAEMAQNPTPEVGRALVRTNWPRTIAWSLRGVLGIIMLCQVLAA